MSIKLACSIGKRVVATSLARRVTGRVMKPKAVSNRENLAAVASVQDVPVDVRTERTTPFTLAPRQLRLVS